MARFIVIFMFVFLAMTCESGNVSTVKESDSHPITLVVHGGAGTIRKEQMTHAQEQAYRNALARALEAGFDVLDSGGKSVDAVIAAISILEDSPLFNAARGAVFTDDGKIELDASIMDGSNLKAGAVAGVTTVKNPIRAAYAVMTQSEHVLLAGVGADVFAAERGLEIVDPGYFVDSARYLQFLRMKRTEKPEGGAALETSRDTEKKFGTVGAVALDRFGNIASGTSTGGMSNKKFGRIGDSPIIGAGTYANNKTCGVSATGWGEYFIRLTVAHDISAMMEYAGLSLADAADSVILQKLPRLGGEGGIIAVDGQGRISMTFNTPGMYRGYIRKKGQARTLLYRGEN